jgi:SAM-dependent methyltransferase
MQILRLIKRKLERPGGISAIMANIPVKIEEAFSPRYRRLHKSGRDFDARYGTDTNTPVPAAMLDIDDEAAKFAGRYYPTPVGLIREMLGGLGISFQGYTFVDFGSGKGRALLLAAEFPFKKIIGVEFSPTLNSIANKNIELYVKKTGPVCKDIQSICQDACAFPIPSGPCVFYYFNPFAPEIMSAVLANIVASLTKDARDIKLVFLKPLFNDLVEASGRFTCIKTGKNADYPYPYRMYAPNKQ